MSFHIKIQLIVVVAFPKIQLYLAVVSELPEIPQCNHTLPNYTKNLLVTFVKSKAALKKHMKKHNEEYIEKDPLVSDIAEACANTPMIVM